MMAQSQKAKMIKNYERGVALLHLLGKPVPRPKVAADKPPSNGICKYCDGQVVWCAAPSGKRVPLDVHPSGSLVMRDGVALELPANEGERRFELHFGSCRKNSSNKENGT
jgi:hypothetical protein